MLTLIGIVAAVIVVAVIANWKLQFFKWDLMDEIKKFDEDAKNNYTVPTPKTLPVEESKPKRARSSRGRFVADDPNTQPINEAWVGGQAPEKKKSTGAARRGSPSKK